MFLSGNINRSETNSGVRSAITPLQKHRLIGQQCIARLVSQADTTLHQALLKNTRHSK